MNRNRIGPNAWLHHLQLTADEPEQLADYYARTMRMRRSSLCDVQMCEAPARRILFAKGPKRQAAFSAFAFETAEALAAYRARVMQAGLVPAASPSPLFDDTAFSTTDPDGNCLVFGTAGRDNPAPDDTPDARLQHVTLRSKSLPPLVDYYTDKLGFYLADVVSAEKEADMRTAFLASDPEHHSLAVFKADSRLLDHHSYELSGWDRIRDWADHFASLGQTLRWGPGRHGPGNNLFLFIEDPEGNWIELSAEIEVMREGRKTGQWVHCPRTLNLWGDAVMRS